MKRPPTESDSERLLLNWTARGWSSDAFAQSQPQCKGLGEPAAEARPAPALRVGRPGRHLGARGALDARAVGGGGAGCDAPHARGGQHGSHAAASVELRYVPFGHRAAAGGGDEGGAAGVAEGLGSRRRQRRPHATWSCPGTARTLADTRSKFTRDFCRLSCCPTSPGARILPQPPPTGPPPQPRLHSSRCRSDSLAQVRVTVVESALSLEVLAPRQTARARAHHLHAVRRSTPCD